MTTFIKNINEITLDENSNSENKYIKQKKLLTEVLHYLSFYFVKIRGIRAQYIRKYYNKEGTVIDEVIHKTKLNFIENYEEYKFTKITNPKGKLKYNVKLIQEWFDYPNKKIYDKIDFLPGKYIKYNKYSNNNIYNLWYGWKFKEKENFIVDENRIKPIIYHLKEIVCNGNYELFIFNCKILKLILLGKKSGIARSIYSEQRCGKNIYFEYVGKNIIGKRYFAYFNTLEDFLNKFNTLRSHKSYIICDELDVWAGNRKAQNKLKSLITQSIQKYEQKGIDAVNINDFSNTIFLSNNKNALLVEGKGDGRIAPWKASSKHKGDKNYFDNLIITMGIDPKTFNLTKEQKQEAKITSEHFFQYISKIDVTHFDSEKEIPKTQERMEGEINFTPILFKFIRHLFSNIIKSDNNFKCNADEFLFIYKKFCYITGEIIKHTNGNTLTRSLFKLENRFKIFSKKTMKRNYLFFDLNIVKKVVVGLDNKFSFDNHFLEINILNTEEEDDDKIPDLNNKWIW